MKNPTRSPLFRPSSHAAWPVVGRAQQPDRIRQVGVLTGFAADDPIGQSALMAFQARLQNLGWTEGRNIRFHVRWAVAGDLDLMRTFAVELVRMGPDLILVNGNRALAAVQRQTRNIPIVFAAVIDPVDLKRVESLARPGGNATGFTVFQSTILGKHAQILKEIAPGISRIALIRGADVGARNDAEWSDAVTAALEHLAAEFPKRVLI